MGIDTTDTETSGHLGMDVPIKDISQLDGAQDKIKKYSATAPFSENLFRRKVLLGNTRPNLEILAALKFISTCELTGGPIKCSNAMEILHKN